MVGRSSLFFLLWGVAFAAIYALARETYVAVVVEEFIENIAAYLGIGRPKMIAAVAPFVIYGSVAGAAIYAAYCVGVRDRSLKAPFEFIFSPEDERFVKNEEFKTKYYVGLHIVAQETVMYPSVRASRGAFTDRFIASHYQRSLPLNPTGGLVLYEGGALDPDVTEYIEICELPPYDYLPSGDRIPLTTNAQRFTLEARGRNAKPRFAEFEFDPTKTPMIRRIK